MTRDVHDELRARLHEAAGTHQPDRARILAGIERGMAEQVRPGRRTRRHPVAGWLRVAGATAAVAGVLAAGGYAVASAVREEAPLPQRGAAVSPAPTPSPDVTSRPPVLPADPTPGPGISRRPDGSGGPDPSDTPTAEPSSPAPTPSAGPPVFGAEDGPLWSDGSVDPHSNEFWAQSNVTLRTAGELTALTVRLEVAQTGGVSSTGAWRSLPEQDFTQTVQERDGFLVYTWTLKEGRKVPAGRWVFAGQYDHARGGRDAEADRYGATARAGSRKLSVAGGFAPGGGNGTASGGDS
ncbi:hypothetical protein [Streptomyces sp. NPDC093094]|uniref:hypothetical protein n=1 Tax=Streptomyces sp. NPDC093094 TaxID=3366026 RepID=UPI00382E5E85